MSCEHPELDELQTAYKAAVESWRVQLIAATHSANFSAGV
jgi:hypothetical protein